MAQPQLIQIKLSRFDAQPWGFRLQGGVDFAQPLLVQKVNGGSLAEKAGLIPGDALIKINDVDVYNLRHKDAQDIVVRSGNNFVLTVQRGGSTWRPHVTPTGNVPQPQHNSPYLQTVTKTSLAHKQQESQHIGCGYNNAARPYANGGDGNVKSIVNKQYNTPVGIYSDESIAETLSAQAEVLAGGVLGVNFKKNEKEYQPDKSEVLKFLREEETGQSSPEPPCPANFYWTQSHAIGGNERRTPLSHQHHHQEQQHDEGTEIKSQPNTTAARIPQSTTSNQAAAAPPAEPADPRIIMMPVCPALQGPEYKKEMEAAAAALQNDDGPRPLSASGHPACALCGVGIVGVFVRIKDKNLHVECFKCATCGTSLKNQGYYNYNNKLYCEIHAKLAALQNPPAGTDGYVPVPIKPSTKLSANTISSALNTHGYTDLPVVNGGSTAPKPQVHQCAYQNNENDTDLPLPPPPSPTLLQQLEIESQNTAYAEDRCNGINHKERGLQHVRTNSSLSNLSSTSDGSSMSSAGCPTHIPTTNTTVVFASVDEKSIAYSPTTLYHSRQTLASSLPMYDKSNYTNKEQFVDPRPPLPTDAPKQLSLQNENDMNSQNQHGNGGEGGGVSAGIGRVGGKNNLSGGVYSKFLKEYSNKVLTQNHNNNHTHTNTPYFADNSLNYDICSKNTNNTIDIAIPFQPSTQKPLLVAQAIQSDSTSEADFENITDAFKAKTDTKPSPQSSAAAAIKATSANQLNFNPCQQVEEKFATTLSSSTSSVSATTAISAKIANETLLDTINSNSNSEGSNRCDSEQLISASDINQPTNVEIESKMLANQTSVVEPKLDDQPFGEYVTLTGSVIRSVAPPGKGVNINYKVNQGYARPFGSVSGPPAAAPKSPVAYPPQRPAVNAYATLPRSGIEQQQGRRINTYNNYNNYSTQYKKPIASSYGFNKYATMPNYNTSKSNNNYYNQDYDDSLQPQYAEECHTSVPAGAEYFEDDHELEDVNRQNRNNFSWPPAKEDSPVVPTAAPLYIPPPETQHVVPKPLKVAQPEIEQDLSTDQAGLCASEQQPHWQSKSAPQLTMGMQPSEIESSSESCTSTSTTTTTTSEEYQRMYAAQVQAYQIQHMYDQQSGSELDYHMDLEVANTQNNMKDSFYISESEYNSGRRSAQECVESLAAPLNMYKLIDMVREVTPSPLPQSSGQGPRHVVFVDEAETKEIPPNDFEEMEPSEPISNDGEKSVQSADIISTTSSSDNRIESENNMNYNIASEEKSETFVKSERSEILQSQRIFQPTPEIKIEIAPVRHIPPTKIPNPVPKEWINPMVRVLTTAPETPFRLVECPCPKPCECKFESLEPDNRPEKTVGIEARRESDTTKDFQPLHQAPTKGSRLASAMTTAPEWEVRFQAPPTDMIPLPEESEPYMPPPIDMKPYLREDYRPKSPFLSALTTAPERRFEGHFDRDVPIHSIDLPTPKEHLTLSDALRTASDREYTPLNPENATHLFEEQEMEKQKKKHEFQVLDREKELGVTPISMDSVEYYTTEKGNSSQKRKSSAFAAMQAFQPTQEPLISNTPRQSISSYSKDESDPDYERYYKAKERNKKRIDYYQKKEEEFQQQNIAQSKNQEISETKNTCLTSSLNSYTKQNSSSESSSTVQLNTTNTTSAYASTSNQASRSSYQSNTRNAVTDMTINNLHEVIEETTEELEHSEVLFPPPSPLSHLRSKPTSSGLHKADTIPKYQRNWTILPTQSPVRTPEPQELRENVPLAFVDAPVASSISNPVPKPMAQINTTIADCNQQKQETNVNTSRASIISTSSAIKEIKKQQQQISLSQQQSKLQSQFKNTPAPIIAEQRVVPQVTMAFQPLDDHLQTEESQIPSRPYTPSMHTKPVPVVPFYQTPEALCFDECAATHARAYDRCSASPFPDRARSPAPGPPPNPLAAIRSSRPKDNELSSLSPRILQAGSITTGQSYLGAQQLQQQTQILSHFEQSSNAGRHNYTEKPEVVEERQIGDYTVQRREKESQKAEQTQSSLESQTKMQVGNTQIERRRRVTEEYEHTQSARSVEIRTGSKKTTETANNSAISSADRRKSYGQTGYVANQARRLSGLEQEITNLTSQSQAISARAATLSDTSFPQMISPEVVCKFPTKPLLPPHDEPERPSYVFSTTPYNKMVGPPPGFNKQEQQKQSQQKQQQLSTAYEASAVSQQQKSLSTYSSSNFTTSTSTASSLSSLANATNVGNLTQASITNNYQSGAASATTACASGICPVTGTFCRPGHTCCRQQQLQAQTNATGVTNYNQNNNVKYRPNASTGITDNTTNAQASAIANAAKATDTTTSQVTSAIVSALANTAAAAAPTSFPPPNSIGNNKSNVDLGGSTGVGSKGAFGATSAPKRGRGIINKAVAPELCTKPTNANATQPHKVNLGINKTASDTHQTEAVPQSTGDATSMLADSIGRINMGEKMDNFMAEAGKIISNMLEARLVNNCNTMPTSSHGGSTSSLRSNCSSNQSKSPIVVRKRFGLEDFKHVDPTEPEALKPVIAIQQLPEQNRMPDSSFAMNSMPGTQIHKRDANKMLTSDAPTHHPMGKVLDICDSNKQFYTSSAQPISVTLQSNGQSLAKKISKAANRDNSNCDIGCPPKDSHSATEAVAQPETVIYRENVGGQRKSRSGHRSGELSTHAMDRRSYIEPNDLNVSDSAREGPAFSISVRALGMKVNDNDPSNIVMPPENEHVVSQLLKDGKRPICCQCNTEIKKGPFITALGRIWCPEHFICVNANCRRPLQDIGFVEEKGDLYCEFCFEKYLAPSCSKCGGKIKGDCLNAIGKQFHPECFTCGHCGKLFGNTPFFLEDGKAYCEADWNELFTTKCFACGFPVEAGDRWVEALNHNYHSQCFNCTYCKQNLEGQSFYNKGGRPFCKNHAR